LTKERTMQARHLALLTLATGCLWQSSAAIAEGEAGFLTLRAQGHFYVGLEISEAAETDSVEVKNQMYVGYQLPAERRHPLPLVLIHGGGGQSTDWFSTPDGRDGWRDYFLADGFDVYWVDRPGYGRSPTNLDYGELKEGGNTRIISFLATAEHWPGVADDHSDPAILAWLASSPPGPYAGNAVAASDIAELLDRIGPAILITHSAGAMSGWWAAELKPDKVAGIIAIEPGASNVVTQMRSRLHFEPPLQADFMPVKDATDCELQGSSPSRLPRWENIQVQLVGSELGLSASLPCAAKAFSQAGVPVRYTYLPDLGFRGNGHFMMAETNNGELARVIIGLAEEME
jgi:pimeloyl-ACP methyl ester carboxylesterase